MILIRIQFIGLWVTKPVPVQKAVSTQHKGGEYNTLQWTWQISTAKLIKLSFQIGFMKWDTAQEFTLVGF